MWTAFHRQLTLGFLRNLFRSTLALMVAFISYHALTLEAAELDILGLFLMILSHVLPMSLLVASLFTVGRAARHHELTALKAAGWPLHRIMWPVLMLGVMFVPISSQLFAPGFASDMMVETDAGIGTTLHADRARPLVSLLAVVLGISFGATTRPRSMFTGFLLGACFLVGYFVLSATAQALGRHGFLPPMVAGWLPILVSSGLACVWWRKASR